VIEPYDGGVVLTVHVIPRASKSALAGTRDGALLVRLQAPPVEGAANEALIALLAATLDIPRRRIVITSGATSRRKRVRIEDVDWSDAAARLGLG
jgi:hypothetical protein